MLFKQNQTTTNSCLFLALVCSFLPPSHFYTRRKKRESDLRKRLLCALWITRWLEIMRDMCFAQARRGGKEMLHSTLGSSHTGMKGEILPAFLSFGLGVTHVPLRKHEFKQHTTTHYPPLLQPSTHMFLFFLSVFCFHLIFRPFLF